MRKEYDNAINYFLSNQYEYYTHVADKFGLDKNDFLRELKTRNIKYNRKNIIRKHNAEIFTKYYLSHPEMNFIDIRKKFGYCVCTANTYLKMCGISNTRDKIKRDDRDKRVQLAVQYYQDNIDLSVKTVASKYNISRKRLTNELFKQNIPFHNLVLYNSKNGFKAYTKFHKEINNVNTLNEDFFENIDTEEKAYWLGFLLADGSISNSCNSITIGLSIRDYDHLHRFKMALKSIDEIKEYKTNILKNTKRSYDACKISINSKKIKTDLINHNVFPQKSLHEKPDYMLPKYLIRHYIRGFFDGDGWISIYQRNRKDKNSGLRIEVGFGSSKELLEYIYTNLIEDVPTFSKVKIKPFSSFYKMETSSISTCIDVLKYLYNDATIYLPRKFERALKVCRLQSTSLKIVNN